jgi:hypothetical protein
MPTQINAVTALSGTGMADGLWLAYIEIQKAHMRDLADPVNNGSDTRTNAIFLMTDGVPTAVSLYLNNPKNSNAYNTVMGSSSGGSCTNKTIPAPTTGNPTPENVNTMMQSWFVVGGGPKFNTSGDGVIGAYVLASHDVAAGTHTSKYWMNNGGADAAKPPSAPYSGCSGLMGSSDASNYFSKIPDVDAYGNSMTGAAYKNSHVTGGAVSTVWNSGDLNQSKTDVPYHWGLAMWNSVDSAARNIRLDTNLPNRTGDTDGNLKIQFEVIGYTGNGGVDDGLLKRVANDKSAVGYESAQPTGRYYSASSASDLADAFNKVASDLLRLAR